MAVSFDDVLFPEEISYGSQGGPGYFTEVIKMLSGVESRVGRWSAPLHTYLVNYGIKSYEDLVTVRNFYIARQGSLRAFKFRDPLDQSSTDGGVLPGFSDGENTYAEPSFNDQSMQALSGSTTQFQLVKEFVSGASTISVPIYAPRTSTIRVAGDGTTEDLSGWSVNSSGIVTFDSAPSNPKWGGNFDRVVRFDEEADEWLGLTADDFGSGSIPRIGVTEVRGSAILPANFYFGGAFEAALTADYTVSWADGSLQLFETSTASIDVILPDPTTDDLPTGRYGVIANSSSSSQSITLKDHDLTTLVTLAAGNATDVFLHIDGADNKLWFTVGS